MALASAGLAQRCQAELSEVAAALPPETPVGLAAAELLAAAVAWVEPALPQLAVAGPLPLRPGEPGYEAVSFLAERGLLSADWEPGALTSGQWGDMLQRFAAWYGVDAPAPSAGGGTAPLIADLSALLERISQAVRPVALLATEAGSRSRLAFAGLVWNWTVYPRLIVLAPWSVGADLGAGVRAVLERLGNCAVEVDHYVLAPEGTARRLFLANNRARMYVVGSTPHAGVWPLLVSQGRETEFFDFAVPELEGAEAFAAVFEGPAVAVQTLLRMMPRLRTNLPPHLLVAALQTPR